MEFRKRFDERYSRNSEGIRLRTEKNENDRAMELTVIPLMKTHGFFVFPVPAFTAARCVLALIVDIHLFKFIQASICSNLKLFQMSF